RDGRIQRKMRPFFPSSNKNLKSGSSLVKIMSLLWHNIINSDFERISAKNLSHSGAYVTETKDGFTMITVYRYAMKYKWMIVIALFFMFIELIVELIQPLFIQQVIDNGIMINSVDNVMFYLLIMFAVSLIALFAGIFNTYFTSHL